MLVGGHISAGVAHFIGWHISGGSLHIMGRGGTFHGVSWGVVGYPWGVDFGPYLVDGWQGGGIHGVEP